MPSFYPWSKKILECSTSCEDNTTQSSNQIEEPDAHDALISLSRNRTYLHFTIDYRLIKQQMSNKILTKRLRDSNRNETDELMYSRTHFLSLNLFILMLWILVFTVPKFAIPLILFKDSVCFCGYLLANISHVLNKTLLHSLLIINIFI